METEQVIKRLHEGMEVHAADGTKLGKITQILYGADTSGRLAASEEETCMEVHHGFFRRESLYLPCRLVAGVTGNTVTLSIDAHTARETPTWHHKPTWAQ